MADHEMGESSSSASSSSPPVRKSLLVCFGERKRPVTFTSDGTTNERKSLLSAVKEAYENSAGNIGNDAVMQIKSELWGGEFVDLREDEIIPDRAVVRVVAEVLKQYT